MKLLFDENLSPRLVATLASEFPESAHIETLGMRGETDAHIWNYARDSGFVIVSKDNDFSPAGIFTRSTAENNLAFNRQRGYGHGRWTITEKQDPHIEFH